MSEELSEEELEQLEKPLEVKVIKDVKEEVEEDLDYMDLEITDEEVKEFEDEKV